MDINRSICPAVILLGFVFAAGSAFARKPAPALLYPFSEAKSIKILPIVDARHDKKLSVNLEKLQKEAQKSLKSKRYQAALGTESAALANMNADDLKEATPDIIGRLGSSEDRWVMVVCLNDVVTKLTFGSTGNAEIAGFLFDKRAGKLAWSNTGVGQAGQGGLAGMMMKSSMKGEALSAAMWNMLSGIPKQPKPAK